MVVAKERVAEVVTILQRYIAPLYLEGMLNELLLTEAAKSNKSFRTTIGRFQDEIRKRKLAQASPQRTRPRLP